MGEGSYSSFPSASPWMPSIQLQPPEAPKAEQAQVGRGERVTATWEPTRRRAEKEKRQTGGREQRREAGRREGGGEREERGRDGGETLEQRNEELGLARGAGKGGQRKGSGGTWGRDREPGGRTVQPDSDLPGSVCACEGGGGQTACLREGRLAPLS